MSQPFPWRAFVSLEIDMEKEMKARTEVQRIQSAINEEMPSLVFLSERQVASYLNMSVQWLRKCRANGVGPIWKQFGNAIRYSAEDLGTYVSKSSRGFTGEQDSQNCRSDLK